MKIIDISRDITSCEIYPGDPPVTVERVSCLEDGGACNLSAISTGLHNGTHIDAPVHFLEGADSIEKLDLTKFLGECYVIQAPEGPITSDFVKQNFPSGAARVLIRSGGGAWFTREAAETISLSSVITLIGTDALSVGTEGAQTDTHIAFLQKKIALLENLDLSLAAPGRYFLAAQPLKIGGAEAAPARAVLLTGFISPDGGSF